MFRRTCLALSALLIACALSKAGQAASPSPSGDTIHRGESWAADCPADAATKNYVVVLKDDTGNVLRSEPRKLLQNHGRCRSNFGIKDSWQLSRQYLLPGAYTWTWEASDGVVSMREVPFIVKPFIYDNFSGANDQFLSSVAGAFSQASGMLTTTSNGEVFLVSKTDRTKLPAGEGNDAVLQRGVDYTGALTTTCPKSTCEIGVIFNTAGIQACAGAKQCHPTSWFEFAISLGKDIRLISVTWPVNGARQEAVLASFANTGLYYGGPLNFRIVKNLGFITFLTDAGPPVCLTLPDSASYGIEVGVRWKSWDNDPDANTLSADYLQALTAPSVSKCNFPLP